MTIRTLLVATCSFAFLGSIAIYGTGCDDGARSDVDADTDSDTDTDTDSDTDTDTDTEPPPTWIALEGGMYMMGHTEDDEAQGNPTPRHWVDVAPFEMMRTEVTVALYRECVDDGVCSVPNVCLHLVEYKNWNADDRDNHPVNCVDFNDANVFCEWFGGRLPSEAEWEYAARSAGDEDFLYPWGLEEPTCDLCVMDENPLDDGHEGCDEGRTWEVCSKPEGHSLQGICDLSGNIHEMTVDYYHYDYEGAPDTSDPWLDGGDDSLRISRGGNFSAWGTDLYSYSRWALDPEDKGGGVGFRCARDSV